MASNREEYIKAVKLSFIALAKKKVIAYLVAKFAFLAWGPIGPLLSLVVEKVLTIAVEAAETGIFFVYVDFRVAAQSTKFTDAALKNYRVQQSGTQEEKNEAEKQLIDAFDSFVKLNRV